MNAVARVLERIEQVLVALASLCLFAIMSIVFADVFLRYLFNSPLSFSYDLVSLYLTVGVFFFGLSNTLRHDEHVAVDIVYRQVSPAWRRWFDVVTYALSSILFALMFWAGLVRAVASTVEREVMATVIAWPAWLAYWLVPIGTLPIALLCLVRLVHRLRGDETAHG